MSVLDKPLRLRCGAQLRHRIAMAPLTNTQSEPDGQLGDDELRFLRRRAPHFALLSTCAAFVSEEGKAWRGQLGIAHERHVDGLSRLAEALAAAGATGIVQLHHAGALATEAPARRLSAADGEGVRSATIADIEGVTKTFVDAALRAETAGFKGVEVHGANGYLFTQFLSPVSNTRTDAYGGDLAGRARCLRETVRAVRAATKPGFAVGVRISPVDVRERRGLRLKESQQLATWLAEDGVDFVHLSLAQAWGAAPFEPSEQTVVRAIRTYLPPDVALVAAGGILTRADAERTVAEGADVVALGRAAIVQPDWVSASKARDYASVPLPWTRAHLSSVDVGPAFERYLEKFPGLIEGGAPPRDG